MPIKYKNLRVWLLATMLTVSGLNSLAQVTLGNSPYTENFDGLPLTMPAGWTFRTGASPTSLGTPQPVSSSTWAMSPNDFHSSAAAEAPLTAGSNAAAQAASTDRAIGLRPNVTFGETGQAAAVTLQIDNTTGKTGFAMSMKHMTFDNNANTTTYTIEYTTVAAGTSGWTALGTYSTTVWGSTLANYNFGTAFDNIPSSVWIRVIWTSILNTSGRDNYGIDDVVITWASSTTPTVNITSANPAAPAATISQGSTSDVLYRADLTVAASSAVLTAANFTTSAGYLASDLANLKLWYQNTSTFDGTGTLISTLTTGLGPGVHTFTPVSKILPTGAGYLFLTGDVSCSAATGITFSINAVTTANFSFTAATKTAIPAPSAGGVQTISAGGTPLNVTGAAIVSGNGQLTISWTNPPCYDEIMIVATDNGAPVSTIPVGDGSLYTANTSYNDGTNYPNMNANEFCIYRGVTSPVIMTGLINGTQYNLTIFTRLATTWTTGVALFATPTTTATFPFRSKQNGPWNDYNTWEKNTGTWVAAGVGEFPNSPISDVLIQAGHTVILNTKNYAIKNLTVAPTGRLYCNTNLQNKFLNVYGDILCNGTIGNGSILDDISFNFGGPTCHIYGTGVLDCLRMRKNTGTATTTTVTIDINVNTWYNGLVLWNNFNGIATALNVIINSTVTCNNNGSIAIDGPTGTATANSYGTYTVNGTLNVGGVLYLTTNNIAPYTCTVTIGTAGTVAASTVSMAASGTAKHLLNIASGGKLNISGVAGIIPFSATNNLYTLSPGSTVEYSASSNEPVESGLSYSNLTVSGSGTKTANGNVSVGKTFLLAAGSFSMSALQMNIAANGTLTGNGGNFSAGSLGGTVNFAGNGTINGTTAVTFYKLNTNAGIVSATLTNCSAQTLNLIGGIFSIGAANQFNMLVAGTVTATTGVFSTGVAGGILNFNGSGTFTGNSNPYNVYASGAVNFGIQTVTIQNGGSFRLNNGGSVITNAPFYATNSSLVYNTGVTNPAATEWTAGASSGRGVPYHVTLLATGTGVNFGSSVSSRTMLGDLTINNGTNFTLSTAGGGDLIIAGNWTRAAGGIFVNSARKVTFNGTAGDQTITILGGGNEKFGYIIINKAAGLRLIQAAAPNATNILLNGNPASVAPIFSLSLLNGDLDLNQQTFNFTSWNGNQNNIQLDGTAGNLTRNINSSGGTGYFIVTNSNAASHTLTISRASATASLLVFGSMVTVTNSGITGGPGNIDFGNTITTINGTLQLSANGFVTGNPPIYGTNSNLIYNSGVSFDRNVEWGTLSGPGFPYNVIVQNGTSLRLNFPALNGNANRGIAGSLSVTSGSTLLLSTTAANTLTVAGSLLLNGTLTLPTVSGGDLYIGADWTRSATGIFTPNAAAVYFNGSANSTITASGGEMYPYLYLSKTALNKTLTLADNITITKELALTTGTFDLADKNATLRSAATGTASFGKMGAAADVTYSGIGRFVVERYIPTGILAGQHGKSWQYLAIPDNGGQTINAGWQEGNVLPTVGTAGLGIIISNNIAGAGFDIIGGVGPTMKTYVPATAAWIGVANTASQALYNQRGYFIFVRGDRNVSAYNTPATVTTLRSTGKLFVPASNPPPSTTVLAGKFESIGNPYASAIDFMNITRPAAPAIDSVFYVWDPLLAGSYGLGGFQTISSVTGYKPTPGGTTNYSSALSYTKIQSGQAFMVHSTGGGGTVSFTENAKISGSNMAYRQFPGMPRRKYFRTTLYTATGNMADANILAFDRNFDNRYDANDAIKILNAGENFGIESNGNLLSIDARRSIIQSDTIHYNFSNLRIAQSYRLVFTPENMIVNGLTAWLEDRFLQTRTAVSLEDSSHIDITISADGGAAVDRFILVFNNKGPLLPASATIASIDQATVISPADAIASISVYPNPVVSKKLVVNFNNKPAGIYKLQIINNAGQAVYEENLIVTGNKFSSSFSLKEISAGNYRLTTTDKAGVKTTQSVLIQ